MKPVDVARCSEFVDRSNHMPYCPKSNGSKTFGCSCGLDDLKRAVKCLANNVPVPVSLAVSETPVADDSGSGCSECDAGIPIQKEVTSTGHRYMHHEQGKPRAVCTNPMPRTF